MGLFDFGSVITDILSKVFDAAAAESLPPVAFLRVLRMGRILRFCKIFQEFHELTVLVNGMWRAAKTIFWSAIMTAVVLMIWSIMTVELINPLNERIAESGVYGDCDRCARAFSSVSQTTLT